MPSAFLLFWSLIPSNSGITSGGSKTATFAPPFPRVIISWNVERSFFSIVDRVSSISDGAVVPLKRPLTSSVLKRQYSQGSLFEKNTRVSWISSSSGPWKLLNWYMKSVLLGSAKVSLFCDLWNKPIRTTVITHVYGTFFPDFRSKRVGAPYTQREPRATHWSTGPLICHSWQYSEGDDAGYPTESNWLEDSFNWIPY